MINKNFQNIIKNNIIKKSNCYQFISFSNIKLNEKEDNDDIIDHTTPIDEVQYTHHVFNQSYELKNWNVFLSDPALVDSIEHFGGSWGLNHLKKHGQLIGSEDVQYDAKLANEYKPKFHSHNKYGYRIDEIEFHEAYHRLMKIGINNGMSSFAWNHIENEGSHVIRAALTMNTSHADQGVGCPLTMTFACIPPLLYMDDDNLNLWINKLTTQNYDPSNLPINLKKGATLGMSMTEKSSGSDVRMNTTYAKSLNEKNYYELIGHKWFTSAPMCDGFLTLAQTDNGLSCFLVPRWLPDGTFNKGLQFQRLKNKLGDHSNASSEVEYRNAFGILVGDEGKGINVIIEMVNLTRSECANGSSGAMRFCLNQAIHHTINRKGFGNYLINQPLMKNVLCDLIIESEACTLMAMRIAKAIDISTSYDIVKEINLRNKNNNKRKLNLKNNDNIDNINGKKREYNLSDNELKHEIGITRLGTAITKYWVTKRAPNFIYETMESIGGNGFTEDHNIARYHRASPLNAIWEGPGNIQCLDILRVLNKEPECFQSFMDEIYLSKGIDKRFDNFLNIFQNNINYILNEDINNIQSNARILADLLSIAFQGSILLRYGDQNIIEGFISSRININDDKYIINRFNYGNLKSHINFNDIIDRNLIKYD